MGNLKIACVLCFGRMYFRLCKSAYGKITLSKEMGKLP